MPSSPVPSRYARKKETTADRSRIRTNLALRLSELHASVKRPSQSDLTVVGFDARQCEPTPWTKAEVQVLKLSNDQFPQWLLLLHAGRK